MSGQVDFRPRLRDKRWDKSREEELLRKWVEEGRYEFRLDPSKPVFSIDTPPPYASGTWHVAAAAHYVQFDVFARYYMMKGYNVLFPMGIDRNGLPVEMKVEQEYRVRARDVERSEFIRLCRELLDRYEKYILEVIRRTGMLANYLKPYRTDAPDYRALTQATFIELWRRGLIYEDDRPTIWCPVCYTPIAEAEINYVKRMGRLYKIRFPLKDGSGYLVIATTRPELIGATGAVLFHPDDERYKKYEGKEVVIPLYGYTVPVLANPIVDPEYGTGVMMLSSYGDLDDVRLFRELGLKPRVLITPDGRMNSLSGRYEGMSVEEAREAIVKDLEREGYLEGVEEVEQNVPTCWRSKNPVEFINVRAFYLKQLEYKDAIRRIADEIVFYPEFHKQILLNWLDSISIDWAISRDRVYGTEIPIWYCKRCGHPNLPEPGRYYVPWRDPPPFDRCEKCGHNEFRGEERTFDTWMDSSISCLYISGYMRDSQLFEKAFPVSVRPQGIDIVRTWLYYTLLRVYQLTGKPAFKYVRLSGMGLDEKGRPMSKSLGNVVEPIPILDKWGADVFRLWACGDTKLGYNYRFSENRLVPAQQFITKLWNIARFISNFPDTSGELGVDGLIEADKHMIEALNEVIDLANEEYSRLDSFETVTRTRHFTWEVFASNYLELVKKRAYNRDGMFTLEEQRSTWAALHMVLKNILLILHPVIPFVTDYIWRELYGASALDQPFPERLETGLERSLIPMVMELNSAIWRYKEMNGLKRKDPISLVAIPRELEPFAKDIKALHNVGEVVIDDSIRSVEEVKIER